MRGSPQRVTPQRVTPQRVTRASTALALVAALSAMPPATLRAQGIRIHGTTTANFLELRPFVDDSVPYASTSAGGADYRVTASGLPVRCADGKAWCYFKHTGSVSNAVPVLQDLDVSAWGFGQGLSLHANVRIRGAMGSQPDLWPRAEDKFDALSAYLQFDRPTYTARLGRQYITSGLGLYNYDGAMLQWRPLPRVTLEGFAGRNLAQGLNESMTTSAIAAVDELPPDRNGLLVGAQFRARPNDASAVHALYQRELRDNRSALYSERIALDGTYHLKGTSFEGAWTEDLTTNSTNELRLRVRAPAIASTVLSVEARRFRPFFELWTIWGAFAPVGFDEGRIQASWRNTSQSLAIDVHGARRKWQESNAGISFDLNDRMGDSGCVRCGECMVSCPTSAITCTRPRRACFASSPRRSICDRIARRCSTRARSAAAPPMPSPALDFVGRFGHRPRANFRR